MKRHYTIVVAQNWALGLSHQIGRGVNDFVRSGATWDVVLAELSQFGEQTERWQWDGAIVTLASAELLAQARKQGAPVVGTFWDPARLDVPQVNVDPAATGRTAAVYFLGQGFRHLAAITTHENPAHQRRGTAFAEQCQAAGHPPVLFDVEGYGSELPAPVRAWLQTTPKPAAVFTSCDALGKAVIVYCRKAGLHVPEDIAVLGCEDELLVCESVYPSLSSVHLPYRKVGFEAARLLDRLLRGKRWTMQPILIPPESVTERLSTSVMATGDVAVRRAVEFIRRHGCEAISVHDVAHHAGISLSALQRRLKAAIGRTPGEEIQRVRIEKAKQLLRETDLHLDEIAERTGYQSGHYLSKIFKTEVGQKAREYRNQYRAR